MIFVIGSLLFWVGIFFLIAIPVLFILAPTLFFFLLAIFTLSTMGVLWQGLIASVVLSVIAFIGLVILKMKTGIDLTSLDWQDQTLAFFNRNKSSK